MVYDVTSKESLNKVKLGLGEINKHVSDSVNKLPVGNKCDLKPKTVRTKEAKDFRKSEAELVGGMDTLQRTISSIERPAFLQKEIDTRNTNNVMAAIMVRKTSMSRAFSEQF